MLVCIVYVFILCLNLYCKIFLKNVFLKNYLLNFCGCYKVGILLVERCEMSKVEIFGEVCDLGIRGD